MRFGRVRARGRPGPRWRATLAALLVAAIGCRGGGGDDVLVFAAASLSEALAEIAVGFAEGEGTRVSYSFGGSNSLAQQVLRGARPDVFVASGQGPMDALEARGMLEEGSRRDLLSNTLVLVARAGSGLSLESPSDLLGPGVGRVALADPGMAPAGVYAREALESLGLWDPLRPKLVFSLDVRTALEYVRRGSADLGIVYATDAAALDGVRVLLEFPAESHTPIRYQVAVLHGAAQREAAARYAAYLQSEEALEAFRRWGFTPARDVRSSGGAGR